VSEIGSPLETENFVINVQVGQSAFSPKKLGKFLHFAESLPIVCPAIH